MITDTARSPYARLTTVPYRNVEWKSGLYRERFDTVARVTVPHLQHMFEEKDISHVLENFRIAAGEAEGDLPAQYSATGTSTSGWKPPCTGR